MLLPHLLELQETKILETIQLVEVMVLQGTQDQLDQLGIRHLYLEGIFLEELEDQQDRGIQDKMEMEVLVVKQELQEIQEIMEMVEMLEIMDKMEIMEQEIREQQAIHQIG
jgi:hypothetical protein